MSDAPKKMFYNFKHKSLKTMTNTNTRSFGLLNLAVKNHPQLIILIMLIISGVYVSAQTDFQKRILHYT